MNSSFLRVKRKKVQAYLMKFNLSAFWHERNRHRRPTRDHLNLVVMTSYIAVPHKASTEAIMRMEFPEFIVDNTGLDKEL